MPALSPSGGLLNQSSRPRAVLEALGFRDFETLSGQEWRRSDISDLLDLPSTRTSRAEQMQHWLWKELSALVKTRAGWQCVTAGNALRTWMPTAPTIGGAAFTGSTPRSRS
jgi:hypothetical protein